MLYLCMHPKRGNVAAGSSVGLPTCPWFHAMAMPRQHSSHAQTAPRQVGVVVLLAQVGCFVPCDEARIAVPRLHLRTRRRGRLPAARRLHVHGRDAGNRSYPQGSACSGKQHHMRNIPRVICMVPARGDINKSAGSSVV